MYQEIDLDSVFVEAGHGFGPPGFELEPSPLTPLAGGGCGCAWHNPLCDRGPQQEMDPAGLTR